METIFDFQHWLYGGALDALKGLPSIGVMGLPALVGAAFGFGMLHALLPGHGKSVLASYYAGDGRLRGALGSSLVLIVTHVGSAVLLVLSGYAILRRTIGGAGRAPALETASHILIALVGLWLLWRAFKPHGHDHGRSGPALAFVTGLVPCPLTTFIMTYAVANGLLVAGLVLSGMFAAGMVVTVAAFPLLAVLVRTRMVPLMTRTERLRTWTGHVLEIAAASAVTILGLWPLIT
ncbi:MAG: hypothetical protein B7Y12_00715 [Rhizobiales bacterium 24-66-13]|jgi:ABC-type nickel/cobalt efflux system permease component RcnA|nr:MAG: hypothetical protein B7Y95_04125 [Rhizobiales bacterium 32-66-11]OYY14032.1 MAG: hypothetical protein B7Y70_00195 [Rhizobiales bacterium 35-68-8]OYZ83123.1 MAG: hypothetical protein B7Y12_00715 [Rhizobiales bacterium 24-66-13]OZB12053.1 MAG: hypothetical protein B7X67_01300 [Rhizobiales bacterium 39-66-18]HQS47256.1 ABC transporter permease [Xanthobacteraceae bacterium]